MPAYGFFEHLSEIGAAASTLDHPVTTRTTTPCELSVARTAWFRTRPPAITEAPLARWQGSLLAARLALCATLHHLRMSDLHNPRPQRSGCPLTFCGGSRVNETLPQYPEADISLRRGIGRRGPIASLHTAENRKPLHHRVIWTPVTEPAQDHHPLNGPITWRSIISISAARSASAAANSFAASFAVLPFEPQTTMPPSNTATAAAIAAGSNRIAPRNIAARTMPPPAMAIREARMNLRQPSNLAASGTVRWRLPGCTCRSSF